MTYKLVQYELELPNNRQGVALSKEFKRILHKLFYSKKVNILTGSESILVQAEVYENQLEKIRKVVSLIGKTKIDTNVLTIN